MPPKILVTGAGGSPSTKLPQRTGTGRTGIGGSVNGRLERSIELAE